MKWLDACSIGPLPVLLQTAGEVMYAELIIYRFNGGARGVYNLLRFFYCEHVRYKSKVGSGPLDCPENE